MKKKLLIFSIVTLLILNLGLYLLNQIPVFAISCRTSGGCQWEYCLLDVLSDCDYECWQYNELWCEGCDPIWERCGYGDCECWSGWDCSCEGGGQQFFLSCHEYNTNDCAYEPQ